MKTSRALLLAVLAGPLACSWAAQPGTEFIIQYHPHQLQQVKSQLQQEGYEVLRNYNDFDRLVVSAGKLVAAATTGTITDPAIATAQARSRLTTLGGVAKVETPGIRRLFPQPIISYPKPSEGVGEGVEEVCTTGESKSSGPDTNLGRDSEGVPYGIKMVQADQGAMVNISKVYKQNVMYCVVDTGLDRANQEFLPSATTGCMPGFPSNDTTQPYRYCYTWYEDANRHGTHTSGTVAAIRNGKGVVGVSAEGAQLYHYNYFGPNMQASDDLEVAAWQECIAELDRRKAASGTPDMKLVISMSYGSLDATEFSQSAIKTLYAARKDVLWIAAAGNGGDNIANYPAAYPEVVSIAAVDWNEDFAAFSTFNEDVELAAPGVQTFSTIPLAMTNSSDFYFIPYSTDIVRTDPVISEAAEDAEFFNKPKTGRVDGSSTGTVTAALAYCGLANSTCEGAEGKICLIQRGNITFCEKMLNCVAGGGVGAIIFNKEDADECERLAGVSISVCKGQPEGGEWPVVVTISQKQGAALRSALAQGINLTATLNVSEIPTQKDVGLELLSGTSMATPTAAGVAGLVWSAHTKCSSDEIRNALKKTAKRPANSTEDHDQHYGYGIVQALAAHEYLQQNPCTGSAVQLAVQCSPKGQNKKPFVGTLVRVQVQARTSTGGPVAGQRVKLSVKPGRLAAACNSYKLITNAKGVATTICRLLKGVNVRFVASTVAAPGDQPARSAASIKAVDESTSPASKVA